MLGFPFDSEMTIAENPVTHELETQFDKAVSSQPLRQLLRKLFTTGIMPDLSDNYLVSAGTDGMTVVVHSGFAVIDGGLALETEDRTLEVTAAHPTLDRIDTVVLRWNENVDVRDVDLYVVQGTPSATPVRPELQRNNSIYEIGLADIFVTRSVVTITDEKITDTRYEAERCGVVRSISEYDTTYIYQQVQADLASFKSEEQADFLAWFDEMKDQLSEDAAGNLQNQIDGLTGRVSAAEDTIEQINNNLTELSEKVGGGMRCVRFGTYNGGNGDQTIDISDLNFTSEEDYIILLNGDGIFSGSNYSRSTYLKAKTATSFTVFNANGDIFSYQIIALK